MEVKIAYDASSFDKVTIDSGTPFEKVTVSGIKPYVLDDTLTISGAVADAGAVGEAIVNAKEELSSATDNEIDDILDKLTSITKNEVIEFSYNKFINLNNNTVSMENNMPKMSSSSTSNKCAVVECVEGDVFTINGTSTTTRMYAFVDSSGNILGDKAITYLSSSDDSLILVAPEDVAWLIINSRDDQKCYKNELTYSVANKIRNSLTKYNAYDVLEVYGKHVDRNYNGIQFTWNDNTITVVGTSTDIVYDHIIESRSKLPDYFEAGKTYKLLFNKTADEITVRITFYENSSQINYIIFSESGTFTIPATVDGIVISVRVESDVTVNGSATINVINAMTNEELSYEIITDTEINML